MMDFLFVSSKRLVLRWRIRLLAGGGREQFYITCLLGFIALSRMPLGFFSSTPRFTELTIGI